MVVEHDKAKPWICTECPTVFRREKLLYHHNRNCHSNMEFKCPHCEKTFNQNGNLKIHISTVHENNRPFNCSFCEAPFKTKKHVWQHEQGCQKKQQTNAAKLPDKHFMDVE